MGGRAGLGPVDKSEGLGAGLAQALSIKVRGWRLGLANRSEGSGGRAGPAWSGTAKSLADMAHRGLARNIPGSLRTARTDANTSSLTGSIY